MVIVTFGEINVFVSAVVAKNISRRRIFFSLTVVSTHYLVSFTLGSSRDVQELNAITGGIKTKTFLLHYNFPPFCIGETGKMTGAGPVKLVIIRLRNILFPWLFLRWRFSLIPFSSFQIFLEYIGYP